MTKVSPTFAATVPLVVGCAMVSMLSKTRFRKNNCENYGFSHMYRESGSAMLWVAHSQFVWRKSENVMPKQQHTKTHRVWPIPWMISSKIRLAKYRRSIIMTHFQGIFLEICLWGTNALLKDQPGLPFLPPIEHLRTSGRSAKGHLSGTTTAHLCCWIAESGTNRGHPCRKTTTFG